MVNVGKKVMEFFIGNQYTGAGIRLRYPPNKQGSDMFATSEAVLGIVKNYSAVKDRRLSLNTVFR